MKKLHQLISEKESELQNLEDSLGLGFPIVEQAKMTQISHLRLELEDLRQIEKSIQLNDNQKIVLEWLKKKYKTTDIEPIELIWRLRVNSNSDKWRLQPPYKNYRYLTEIAQFQLLVAFAEWGMKQC